MENRLPAPAFIIARQEGRRRLAEACAGRSWRGLRVGSPVLLKTAPLRNPRQMPCDYRGSWPQYTIQLQGPAAAGCQSRRARVKVRGLFFRALIQEH